MKLQNSMYRIVNSSEETDMIDYQIELNPEHYIYKAHFPGNPITPGVCIIKMITEVLEQRLDRQLTLLRISNLKFISTISPLDNKLMDIQLTMNQTDESYHAKGIVRSEETVFTKFSLVYR